MVEFQEAGEDFAAGYIADGETQPQLGRTKVVSQVKIVPAIGGGYPFVHIHMQFSKFRHIRVAVIRVVKMVVSIC